MIAHIGKLVNFLLNRKPDPPPFEIVVVHKGEPKKIIDADALGSYYRSQMDEYKRWCAAQVCFNCKAPFGTEKQKGWVTEMQCWECWEKYGSVQSQGGPRARDAMLDAGAGL